MSVVVVHCARLHHGINSTRLVFSWKSETERKECGGVKQATKVIKIRKKKFEKYHVPDTAILIAIKAEPTNADMKIITDSKYVINSLTRYAKTWEEKDWAGVQNGDLFRCITAWM